MSFFLALGWCGAVQLFSLSIFAQRDQFVEVFFPDPMNNRYELLDYQRIFLKRAAVYNFFHMHLFHPFTG